MSYIAGICSSYDLKNISQPMFSVYVVYTVFLVVRSNWCAMKVTYKNNLLIQSLEVNGQHPVWAEQATSLIEMHRLYWKHLPALFNHLLWRSRKGLLVCDFLQITMALLHISFSSFYIHVIYKNVGLWTADYFFYHGALWINSVLHYILHCQMSITPFSFYN